MQEKLQKLIEEACHSLGIQNPGIKVRRTEILKMGDYTTFMGSSIQDPQKIVDYIERKKPEFIGRVMYASINNGGFINFYLSPNYYFNKTKQILEEGENYGRSEIHKGKKILVEHSSPNLFKPFHIGHVMNNTIGESINRFARFSGAEVETISYPSDVSLGIGKAVWALMQDGVEKLNEFKTEEEKLNYLGNCYVVGTKAMEEDSSLEPRIREITKIIYEHTESPEYEAYKIGKEINLSYFKSITKSLGSNFDDFIYESEAGKEGEKLVRENTGKIFEESEGAVVYKGEQDGLHTRVFINKEGYPTYEAKDVGLLSLKFSRYNPDLSIFITDHEQSEYFKVVVTAAGKINPIWKEKTIHRTHGRMSFKGQKMSSRLGGVPIASTLIQAVAEEVKEKSPESSEEIQNMIAISALKFTILKSMAGKNINFDPDTSLSFEGDSGPYLQYSTVRSGSVLEKGHVAMQDCKQTETITDVEKYLDRFPEVAEQCISLWEPHHMVGYLLDLAQAFNSWYGRVKIIDAENKDMPYNLAITRAFQITMKNGLYLLGIETPEKM